MDGVDQQRIDDSEQALRGAIHDSNEVLVSATTVLGLHKHTLILNRTKLVGEKRSALGGIEVMSVRIEDVLNVNGAAGPIFGSIKIATKFTKPGEPYVIGPFRRKDVLKLKRIIQGYIIALQKNINVNPIPTEELRDMLYDLGEDNQAIQ